MAWALAPARLATAVASAHTNLTYSAPTPLQAGIAAALREEDGSFGGVAQLFGANFELLATAPRENQPLFTPLYSLLINFLSAGAARAPRPDCVRRTGRLLPGGGRGRARHWLGFTLLSDVLTPPSVSRRARH